MIAHSSSCTVQPKIHSRRPRARVRFVCAAFSVADVALAADAIIMSTSAVRGMSELRGSIRFASS